jgi:hypothetical protein
MDDSSKLDRREGTQGAVTLRRAWFPASLAVWGLVVLWSFLDQSRSLTLGLLGSLSTVGFALLAISSFLVLGWRLLRRFSVVERVLENDLHGLERTLVELGVGMGTAMLLLFALGVMGAYHPWSAIALVVLPFLGPPSLYRDLATAFRRRASGFAGVRSPVTWALVSCVGVLTLLESLTPARSQDALVYHLAVPARYIAEGGIHYIPSSFFASFPQNVDMLFTLGLLLEGDSLAKCFHWMLAVLATLVVVALSRAVAGERDAARSPSALAAALFGTIPTAALIATWAYVDLGVVFFTLLSVLMLVRFWRSQHGVAIDGLKHRSTVALALAGLFAGITAGCKYTGAAQIVYVVGAVLVFGWTEKRRVSVVLRQAFLAGGIASIAVAPWLIKNMVLTGNPLHPFAHSIFGGRDWDAARASILSFSLGEWGGVQSTWDLVRLPWDVSILGEFFSQKRFDGMIGAAFLLGAPLVFVGLRGSREYRLVAVLGLLYCIMWVATTHQIRFLLPALGIFAALIAASVSNLPDRWNRGFASSILHIAILTNVVIITVHFASHNPLMVVLGQESRHEFLSRELAGGDYEVFRYIDDALPEDSRILFGSCGNPGFLCKRPYHADALFENLTLTRLLEESDRPEDLRKEGFTHLLFRLPYVFDPEGQKSEIPREQQALLGRFLNRHARLLVNRSETCLFELEPRTVSRAPRPEDSR